MGDAMSFELAEAMKWADGWPLAATHCPVCMRPRATDADEDRHAEQDCIEPECWCASICWAEQGGECNPTDDVPSWDNLEGFCMALRSARDRLSSTTTEVERLRGALTLPDGRYEQVCEVGHHTVAGDLLDECPWPLEGWQGEPCRADMESVIVWHHKLLAALSPSTNDTEAPG